MAFQSVPDCAEAVINFTQNGGVMNNILTFARAGGYESADLVDLAAAVDSWVENNYLAGISSSCTYVATTVRGLEFAEDVVTVNDDGSGVGELTTGEPFPSQVTLALKFGTGLTGRSARGRVFLVGVQNTQVLDNENYYDPTAAASMVLVWESLAGVVAPSGWTHVVVSRYTNGAKRPFGTYRAITEYSFTDLKLDTLRGRIKNA